MAFTNRQLQQMLRGSPAEALNPHLTGKHPAGKVVKAWHAAGYDSEAEMRFADLLQQQKLAGLILDYRHHPRKLRLPGGTTYAPDFAVLVSPKVVKMVEIKGYERRDDVIVFKAAAELFGCWEWEMQTWSKREGWRVVRKSDGKKVRTNRKGR